MYVIRIMSHTTQTANFAPGTLAINRYFCIPSGFPILGILFKQGGESLLIRAAHFPHLGCGK